MLYQIQDFMQNSMQQILSGRLDQRLTMARETGGQTKGRLSSHCIPFVH